MAGFLIAFEDGADMVELDVRVNGDGTPVVFHDDKLDRMCGKSGKLSSLSDKEMSKLTIGRKFSKDFSLEPIPKLADVLEMVHQKKKLVNIELKEKAPLAETVRLIQKHRLHDHVLVSAFDWDLLQLVRRQDAGIQLGALYQFHLFPQEALRYGAHALHPHYLGLLSWQVSVAHGLGLTINTWTVNRPQAWGRLSALGVDGLITDMPGALKAWMDANLPSDN